jgi:hypothetical protein
MTLGDLPGDLCTKAGQRKQKTTRKYFLGGSVAAAPDSGRPRQSRIDDALDRIAAKRLDFRPHRLIKHESDRRQTPVPPFGRFIVP